MKAFISGMVALFFVTTHLCAQFGVTGYYDNHLGAEDWDNNLAVTGDQVKADGFGLSVNYWFRLKNYRIEFLPEIVYFQGDQSEPLADGTPSELSWNQIAVFANTNFYLFDLEGDCNCPTFGKDGGFFEKGFFVQLSPGISFWSFESEIDDTMNDGTSMNLLVGIGGGLDIGVSEYITITPLVRYVLGFNVPWTFTDSSQVEMEYQSNTKDLLAGLNLIYRLDYKKRRF